MSIKTTFWVDKPNDVDLTLTVTMPLKDWRQLREQITASREALPYPAWELVSELDIALKAAVLHYEEKTK